MDRHLLPDNSGWEEPTLDDYSSVLYRRKWIILLIVVVAVVASIQISKRLDPQYESQAVFYVPLDAGTEGVHARLPSGVQDHAKAYAQILKQPDTWAAVAEAVPGKPLDRYGQDVDIVVPREGVIRVYVRDKDPELSARIANEFVAFFNQMNRDILAQNLDGDLERIDAELSDVNSQIQATLHDYRTFLEEHKIASVDMLHSEIERKRAVFEQDLRNQQVEVGALEQQIRQLSSGLSEESEALKKGEINMSSPVVQALEEKVSQLEIDVAGASAEMMPDHPDRRALESSLATARENLERERGKQIASKSQSAGTLFENLRQQRTLLTAEKSAAQARVAALEQVVADLDQEVVGMPLMKTETSEYEQVIADLRARRATLQGTRNDLVTRGIQQKDPAIMIQTARPGVKPVFPIIPLNALVAGLCGLVLGVLYAFVIEHIENRRRMRRLRRIEMEEWMQTLLNPAYQNGSSSIFAAMNLQAGDRSSDKMLMRTHES